MPNEMLEPTMKINKALTLLIFPITLLTGCAALKTNVAIQEPAEGPSARIRLITPSVLNHYRGIHGYPNSECIDEKAPGNGKVIGATIGFERHLNGRTLGMPATELSSRSDVVSAEMVATANQPIAFRFHVAAQKVTSIQMPHNSKYTILPGCTVAVSFVPEPGADYELFFEDCSYGAKRLVTTTSDAKAVASSASLETKKVGQCRK